MISRMADLMREEGHQRRPGVSRKEGGPPGAVVRVADPCFVVRGRLHRLTGARLLFQSHHSAHALQGAMCHPLCKRSVHS
jgi:hypothetical protein